MRLQNTFLLFPGIGEKTETKLWKKGVNTWDGLTSELSGKRLSKAEKILPKARKNLEVGNTHFFDSQLPGSENWRLYRDFDDTTCFFDIETTGLSPENSVVTTVSFHQGGETTTLVRDRDLTKENIQNQVFDSNLLVTFNGKRFDVPFLEQRFDMDIDTPHLDLMYPCRSLDLTGGLKKIEKELGVTRELEDLDGREAIRLWKQYQRGDQQALEKLVKYNRYDAVNLREITEDIHDRLDRKRYRKHISTDA